MFSMVMTLKGFFSYFYGPIKVLKHTLSENDWVQVYQTHISYSHVIEAHVEFDYQNSPA